MTNSPAAPAPVPEFDFLTEDPETGTPPVPKRRLPKPVIWGGAAIILVLLIAFWIKRRNASEVHAEVQTAPAKRQLVRVTVSATGTLQAFTTVDIKSKASGKVLQMAVEEGTRVKKGQLIAVIDRQETSASYKQAVADVESAEANVREAEANARKQQEDLAPQLKQSTEGVADARAKLTSARENLALEAESNPAAIDQAQQTVASARAKLGQSQQALVIEARTREAAVREAQASLNSAKVKLRQAQQQAKVQPSLSDSSVAAAQASVSAAQSNLKSSQESLNQLQNSTQPQEKAKVQAQVNEAKSNLTTAQANLDRQKKLFDQGFVAQSTVETAQNQVDTAQASLQTAQSTLDTLAAGQAAALQQARAVVESSQGNLDQAQANLKTAQANRVQDSLKQGDVEAAQADLHQAEASLKTAQANLRQVAVKQADVTTSIASLRQAEAALRSTRANSRAVNMRRADVDSALAALRQSEATLQSTENNHLTVEAGLQAVTDARAKLTRAKVTADNARQNLAETRVLASQDGVVLQKYVDVGAIIQSGQSGFSGGTSIVQLAQVSRMFIDVLVDEADIAQIKTGQKVDVVLDAYPDEHKSGIVRKIYPLAEVQENVTYIQVQVELNARDVDQRLRPNMNATCDFLIAEKPNALAVPPAAVKDIPGGEEVTVIRDMRAPLWEKTNQDKRKVKVGLKGADAVEILSGLREGEQVVTKVTEAATSTGSLAGGPPGMGGGVMRR